MRAPLGDEIEAFMRRHDLSWRRFRRMAPGDNTLLWRIRALGARPRSSTVERMRAWMREFDSSRHGS